MGAKTKAKAKKAAVALPTGAEGTHTVETVCEALQCSQRTLSEMRSTGEFPPPDFRIGTRPRWLVSKVNRWLAAKAARGC